MLERGLLPTLQRLIAKGAHATMRSEKLPEDQHYRPQLAWASLATGCTAVNHGVTRYWHTANDLRRPALWHLYDRAGCRSGVFGWPLDWPAPSLNGFVVPSHWARDEVTYPPELGWIKRLDRAQQASEREGRRLFPASEQVLAAAKILLARPSPTTLLSLANAALGPLLTPSQELRTLRLRQAKLALSTDLFARLAHRHRPHFAAFTTFLVDFASHRYWRYHEPELFDGLNDELLASAVQDAYRQVDRSLCRLLSRLPSEAVIAVVSEHGMEPEPISGEVGDKRYVIRGRELLRIIDAPSTVHACPVARWVAMRSSSSDNLDIVAERLRTVVVTETGLSLFQVINNEGREIIVKLALPRSIERYAQGNLASLNLRWPGGGGPFEQLCRPLGSVRSAMHARDGILVLYGLGVPVGQHLPDMRLIDFAPTLLALSGLSSRQQFDGTALSL